MKIPQFIIFASFFCGFAYSDDTYKNFVYQFQTPSAVAYDVNIDSKVEDLAASGVMLSPLEIKDKGARFELWTIRTSTTEPFLTDYLLSVGYVASYIPTASVYIRTVEDPDPQAAMLKEIQDNISDPNFVPSPRMPRTRADQSFQVDVVIGGLKNAADPDFPEASKSVNFYRHLQSYGVDGTGVDIDRDQAILDNEASITENKTHVLPFDLTSVPGADKAKIRGEERFTVKSLPDNRPDYMVGSINIDSEFIQIWPVADGSISGIENNQLIRYSAPQLTLTLNDLYPSSTTYAQVYKGEPQLGVEGKIVPGSSLIINDSVPNSRVLVLKGYESVFEDDGVWTMELLTKTPFGTDRLAYVSFNLDRTMKFNGTITTIE